jgi:chemotaxis protein histidine kinase CheA
LWDGVERGDPDALDSLYRAVHSLAGSGETFGFPKLSEAAKQCEGVLLTGVESGQLQHDAARAELELVLAELDR